MDEYLTIGKKFYRIDDDIYINDVFNGPPNLPNFSYITKKISIDIKNLEEKGLISLLTDFELNQLKKLIDKEYKKRNRT